MLDQIVLGQQPVGIAREMEQQLQHLGLDFAYLAVAAERETRHVDLAISEVNSLGLCHLPAPQPRPHAGGYMPYSKAKRKQNDAIRARKEQKTK